MSYQKHNFTPGAVLLASQLNDMDNEIETLSQGGSGGTVLSDDFKEALLNCFENVVWINENGQTYYDALYDSLYQDNMWFITNILTGCITSNNATNILKNNSYVATITANEGYTLDGATVNISMGGNDVTNLYYSSGSINIPNVTGDLVITVTASSSVASITAVYTQSGTIYDTDTLDSLKDDLVVTANYIDSSTQIVPTTDYTLSGDLMHEQVIIDLLDGVLWTDGIAFDDNGNQLDRPTLACSDFLPVTPGTLYTYSKPVSGGTDAYGMGLYLYDSNKGWIGRETSAGTQSGTEYVKTYTPASNVAYVRLMSYVTAKSGAEFTYDATPSSWTSTITVSYGGKTATFDVSVTRSVELFTNAVLASQTVNGTVVFNADGSVNMQSTGSTTNWSLRFGPTGSTSFFPAYDSLKGHTVRCAYSVEWAAKTADSYVSFPYILVNNTATMPGTRLRYSADILHTSMSEEGNVDFVIPSSADGWAAGTGSVDNSYLTYVMYLYTSTAGANVTIRLKFYDLGII